MEYEDHDRVVHPEPPPATADPDQWRGVLVHVWDPDDPEEEQHIWVRHPIGFVDWIELITAIANYLAQYGIEIG